MKSERTGVNRLGSQINEIAEYLNILLPARFCKSSIYEKKLIPSHISPPENMFGFLIQCNSTPNGCYERGQQMAPYRWADAFGLNLGWLGKTSRVRAPDHTIMEFSANIDSLRISRESEIPDSIAFRQIYKSIRRHIRNYHLKPFGQLPTLKRLERVSTRVEGNVIKTTEDTRGVLAAAYVQMCRHHDYFLKSDVETKWYLRGCQLNEHHADLKELVCQIGIPSNIRIQLITKVLADECLSAFLEYLMRALVQRKHGRLIFDSYYRDRRYDSHWLIDASNSEITKLHFWSIKPRLPRVIRYVQKHGY